MQILLVVNLYAPDFAGGASLYTDLSRELAARGHDVTVRTGYPYFPEWADKSGQNGWRIRRSHEHGLRLERHGMYLPNPASAKERAIYEVSFFLSLLRSFFRGGSPDVILAFSTMVSPVGVAVVTGKLRRRPVMVSVQDISSGGAAAARLVGGRVARIIRAVERRLYRSADHLVTITPEMVDRVHELCGDSCSVDYVPNWLSGSLADEISELTSREHRSSGSTVRMLYSGNIAGKQALLTFCERIHATEADFELHIHGAGPGAEAIHRWWDEHRDPRFVFGEMGTDAEFVAAIDAADLFLITERPESDASYMPSKLIPAISVGTPILAVCDPASPLGREMANAGLGPMLTWDDIERFPEALADARDGEQHRRWRANCLARAKAYERTTVIDQIELGLEKLASARRR